MMLGVQDLSWACQVERLVLKSAIFLAGCLVNKDVDMI